MQSLKKIVKNFMFIDEGITNEEWKKFMELIPKDIYGSIADNFNDCTSKAYERGFNQALNIVQSIVKAFENKEVLQIIEKIVDNDDERFND